MTITYTNKYLFIRVLSLLLISLLIIVPVIFSVAFFTVAERKILAKIHRREGPSIVGFWGLLQPISDGLKLILKEIIIPIKAYPIIFVLSPFFTFFLSLLSWSIIPFTFFNILSDFNFSILLWLAFGSLSVYSIILAGWSSNSKYSLLGSLRACSQMIAYEISISLCILPIIICSNSLNFIDIIYIQKNTWFCFPLLPIFIIFIISMYAETNRAPFDLPEAEAELVAGFFVEYSSITFAMFFLGEYSNMLLMSAICVTFFLGGWWPILNLNFISYEINFSIKICIISIFYIFIRGAYPRLRYDQLMTICWKIFMPFLFSYLIFSISILLYCYSLFL